VALDKCRIRKSGTRYFVELHVEVDGRATVQAGHDIGGRVRGILKNSPLRIADAFIHIEPAQPDGEEFVHAHDDRAIFQASHDELPDIDIHSL